MLYLHGLPAHLINQLVAGQLLSANSFQVSGSCHVQCFSLPATFLYCTDSS